MIQTGLMVDCSCDELFTAVSQKQSVQCMHMVAPMTRHACDTCLGKCQSQSLGAVLLPIMPKLGHRWSPVLHYLSAVGQGPK